MIPGRKKMIDKIQERLKQIEQEKNVKILFAVEAGSRAWGFASPDSDYDVRFVYVQPLNNYLTSIGNTKDTIELNDGELDFAGWDIKKALSLANKSNPGLMEWIYSPIVYRISDFYQQLMFHMKDNYSKKALVYHYGSLAKRTWHEHLQKDNVSLKKYFYALRPVLCVMHLQRENYFPPVNFDELIRDKKLDSDLTYELNMLLNAKRESSETTINELSLPNLRKFIVHWMEGAKGIAELMPNRIPDTKTLNQLGINTILNI